MPCSLGVRARTRTNTVVLHGCPWGSKCCRGEWKSSWTDLKFISRLNGRCRRAGSSLSPRCDENVSCTAKKNKKTIRGEMEDFQLSVNPCAFSLTTACSESAARRQCGSVVWGFVYIIFFNHFWKAKFIYPFWKLLFMLSQWGNITFLRLLHVGSAIPLKMPSNTYVTIFLVLFFVFFVLQVANRGLICHFWERFIGKIDHACHGKIHFPKWMSN